MNNEPIGRPDAEKVCNHLEACEKMLQNVQSDTPQDKVIVLQQENSRLIEQLEQNKATYKHEIDRLRDQLRSYKTKPGKHSAGLWHIYIILACNFVTAKLLDKRKSVSPAPSRDEDSNSSDYEDAADDLTENIQQSQSHKFTLGKHNFYHITYSDDPFWILYLLLA